MDSADSSSQINAGGDVSIGGDVVAGDKIVILQPVERPADTPCPELTRAFTGRAAELARLQAELADAAGVIIWGAPGVGKTQLALRLGRLAADKRAGTLICVDLYGTGAPPPLARVMARVLEKLLGQPIPSLPDGVLADQYRSRLAERPVVLVLDNAGDEAQVEALLPPENCPLIVTARRQLAVAGLPAHRLGEFTPDEARTYVRTQWPKAGAALEPLVELSGGLPFALHHLALAFTKLPPATAAAAWLANARDARVRLHHTAVEAALNASAQPLSPELRDHWQRLAVFAAPFEVSHAQIVWDLEPALADTELGELWNAGLIEHAGGVRYRLHDLTRLYAAQHLAPASRAQTEARLAAALLAGPLNLSLARSLAESVANPAWPLAELAPAVAQAHRQLLLAPALSQDDRRAAAFRLTRMRALGGLPAAEMEVCLDLIGRFVTRADNLEYLADTITQALTGELTEPQRAVLRVHRAAKLGGLGRLAEAEADYLQAQPELGAFPRLAAQAELGLGNIALFRGLGAAEPEDRGRCLREAAAHYLAGDQRLGAAAPDPILRVTLAGHLAYTYGALEQWPAAHQAAAAGFQILMDARARLEPEDYDHYWVYLLEQASLVRELAAEADQQRGEPAAARANYQAALELAEQAIEMMRAAPPSEGLIVAYNNAGRFLWALRTLGAPEAAELAARAGAYWRPAAQLARRLRLTDHLQEAESYLQAWSAAPA